MPALTIAALVGAVLLLGGGASLAVARTSWVALVVLVLAAASLGFEARYVPGVGLFAIWGWFGVMLAGFGLQGTWSSTHPTVVLVAATLTAAGTYLAGLRAWRRIDADPFAPAPFLTDRHTVVLHTADTSGYRGQAIVGGQLWAIYSRRGRLQPGQRVWVADVSRHELIVEPDLQANDQVNDGDSDSDDDDADTR